MLTPTPLVFSGNLMSGQVGWPHAASGIVNSGKIGDAAVVSGSIASGQVGRFHLASGVINSGNVIGPALSSGTAVPRWVGSTGKVLDGSKTYIDDTGTVRVYVNDSSGGTVRDVMHLHRVTTAGTATSGIGGDLNFGAEPSDISGLPLSVGDMYWQWTDPNSTTRKSRLSLTAFDYTINIANESGLRCIGWGAAGSGPMVGFLGNAATPVPIQSGDLGLALANYGLIVSGTASFASTVTSGQIGSGLVASGAVPGFFGPYRGIMSGTVGVFDLGSGAVVAGAVGSGAIQSGNVASGQIGNFHVASGRIQGSLGGGVQNIASGTVGNRDIASGGITTSGCVWYGALASGAINSGDLADNSVVSGSFASGQIAGLGAGFAIASGTFNGFELGSGSIVSGRIASGQIGRNHFGPDPTYLHNGNNGCRVSLSSGTPITSGMGVSGTVNLYLVPFRNNTISLIDSSGEVQWIRAPLNTQLNLSGVLASGAAYDVYGIISGGNVALELGAAWSFPQSGVREGGCAIAYNTSGGFWTKSGDATRRVLATVTSFFSGVLSDGDPRRLPVWNFDKDMRVPTPVKAVESGANSWTYGSATYRPWNLNSGNAIQVVLGLSPAEPIVLRLGGTVLSNASPNYGIGVDNTTTGVEVVNPFGTGGGGTSTYVAIPAEASLQILQGVHRMYMLERVAGAVNSTFFANTGPGVSYCGMVGEVWA